MARERANWVGWLSLVVAGTSLVLSIVLTTFVARGQGTLSEYQLCIQWAQFLRNEQRNGLTPQQLDTIGAVISNHIAFDKSSESLASTCGQASELLGRQ